MSGALRYEVARLRTLRSTWWLLGISLLVSTAIAVIVALVARSNDLGEEALAVALTGGSEFSGIPLPAVFAGLTGAFAFGHEYRYGTIRPALCAVPGRTALLLAKTLVTAGWAAVLAALNVAVGYLALLVVPGQELLDTGVAWDPVGRAVVGFVVLVALWSVVGLALAGLLRSLPAAIVMLLVIPLVIENILFAVLNFVPALDGVSWLAKYLPFTAGGAMVAVFDPGEFDQPDLAVPTPLQGGITFAAFGLVLLALCWVAFRRRDA